MSNTSTTVQVGPGGGIFLFTVLLLLKVFGEVDWSWWIITAPLWAGLAILLVIGIGVAIAAGIAHLLDERDRKKRRAARIARQGNLTTRNRL